MGWTAVEPLSPGFFQIDPSVMTLDAEGNRVFNTAGAGSATKALIKKIWLAARKAVKEAVQATVKSFIKSDVAVKISDDVGEGLTEQAMKNVDAKTFPSGLTGKELSEQYPGSWMAAVKRETGDLASKQIDDLAASTKGGLKDVVGEGGEITLKQGGAEVTEVGVKDVAETGAKEVTEEVVEKSAKKEVRESAMERYAKYATKTGLVAATAFAIFSPVANAIADAVGDTANAWLGNDCIRPDLEEKYPDESSEEIDTRMETCEAEGMNRTLMLGAAGVGIVGLLGVLIVTRLIPKSEPKEETDTEDE